MNLKQTPSLSAVTALQHLVKGYSELNPNCKHMNGESRKNPLILENILYKCKCCLGSDTWEKNRRFVQTCFYET